MRLGERDGEFSVWVEVAQPQLLRKAYLLAGDQHSAHDLVQQVLLSTYLAWNRVDHPTAYATTSLVRAFFKVAKVRQRELVTEVLVDTAAHPSPSEERLTLLQALRELPPRMRATVMLRFWDDLSVRDTAHLLRCSEGTVKSTTSKALAHLRSRLGEDFEIDHPVATAPGGIR